MTNPDLHNEQSILTFLFKPFVSETTALESNYSNYSKLLTSCIMSSSREVLGYQE